MKNSTYTIVIASVAMTVASFGNAATWVGGIIGTWTTPGNWSPADVPDTAGENASIDGGSAQTTAVSYGLGGLTAITGAITVDSGDTLNLTHTGTASGSLTATGLSNAGTLNVDMNLPSANGLSLTFGSTGTNQTFNTNGGVINLRVSAAGRGQLRALFDVDVATTNAGAVNINTAGIDRNGATFRINNAGTFNNNGSFVINGTKRAGLQNSGIENINSQLRFTSTGAVTLGGTGSVTLNETVGSSTSDDVGASIQGTKPASTATALTNGASHMINGNGSVGLYVSSSVSNMTGAGTVFYQNTLDLTNAGLIKADVNGRTLIVDPNATIANAATGRLVATGGGTLRIGRVTAGKTFTSVSGSLIEAQGNSTINIAAGNSNIAGTLRGSGTISKLTGTAAASPTLTGVSPSIAALYTPVTDTAGTLTLGGTLQPGNSAAGSFTSGGAAVGASTVGGLTIGSNLGLTSASILDFQFGALTSAGTTYDTTQINGSLTLDGTLQITRLAGFSAGTYHLLTYTGALANNGLNAPLPSGGFSYQIDVANPNTVDLVVTAVPEPASLACIAVVGLFATRRRRSR